MATRSRIGVMRKDDTIDHIYCHWDGYPEYNGSILFNHYSNINKLNQLIKLGDMSSLQPNLYPKKDEEHGFGVNDGERQKDVSLFYNRDREEDWKRTQPSFSKNLKRYKEDCKLTDCNFAYLFDEKNSIWYIADIPNEKDEEMSFKELKYELFNLNVDMDSTLKEDYIIFDGIELLKDLDYYEYRDSYSAEAELYFEIKDMFDKKEFNKYFDLIKEYLEDMNEENLKEKVENHERSLKAYFNLDDSLNI
ncbi:MAG: hypothetical protein PHO63_01135 [Bacilli bacterium]|nr:hypothetical protein [Bacilli bacterium]MDD4808457.1 hypothetical protein [Bacilli bacterium]